MLAYFSFSVFINHLSASETQEMVHQGYLVSHQLGLGLYSQGVPVPDSSHQNHSQGSEAVENEGPTARIPGLIISLGEPAFY